MIGIFAKQARGMFAKYIIKKRIFDPKDLKEFNLEGYKFDLKESKDLKLVFKREFKRKTV